jgi:predicted amidohydrolase
MKTITRIAGIQLSAGPDISRNVARAVEMAEVAAEKGAKVIGFPELCFTPWFPRREDQEAFSFARELAGEEIKTFTAASLKHQVVLVVPFFEKAGDRFYNSAAVIDCGKVLGTYRKLHVPDIPFYKERFYFSPGDAGFPVFETSRGRIGVQICWDNLFPEGTRILALKGADVVFAPTAASVESHTLWEGSRVQCLRQQPLHLSGEPRGTGGRHRILRKELLRRALGRNGLGACREQGRHRDRRHRPEGPRCRHRDLGLPASPQAFGVRRYCEVRSKSPCHIIRFVHSFPGTNVR